MKWMLHWQSDNSLQLINQGQIHKFWKKRRLLVTCTGFGDRSTRLLLWIMVLICINKVLPVHKKGHPTRAAPYESVAANFTVRVNGNFQMIKSEFDKHNSADIFFFLTLYFGNTPFDESQAHWCKYLLLR